MPILTESVQTSGVVNNCLLNLALPTLFQVIDREADKEKAGTSHQFVFRPLGYDRLRVLFAQTYGFEALTWSQWQAILSAFHNNFYLLQLAFAPILRKLLAETSQCPELGNLGPDGRYPALYLEDARRFFTVLGIEVHIYDGTIRVDYPLEYAFLPKKAEIDGVFSNSHFDFHMSDEEKKAAKERFEREVGKLPRGVDETPLQAFNRLFEPFWITFRQPQPLLPVRELPSFSAALPPRSLSVHPLGWAVLAGLVAMSLSLVFLIALPIYTPVILSAMSISLASAGIGLFVMVGYGLVERVTSVSQSKAISLSLEPSSAAPVSPIMARSPIRRERMSKNSQGARVELSSAPAML